MLTTSSPSPAQHHLHSPPAPPPPPARNAPPAPAPRSYAAASKSPSPAALASPLHSRAASPVSRASRPTSRAASSLGSHASSVGASRAASPAPRAPRRPNTVDAATQVTPEGGDRRSLGSSSLGSSSSGTGLTPGAGAGAKRKELSTQQDGEPIAPLEPALGPQSTPAVPSTDAAGAPSSSKRPRSLATKKCMPARYETCDVRDLVQLIAAMLMELIRFNDAIPLQDGRLTRFHSRAPPGISVADYLQRLTTHATLSPPLLLSMVYYIDRLCGAYPAFTISSLTVHRFLIASATVASKGLSDLFWTNNTYARVGGISLKELKVLELEFLTRVEWRIVPKPEVLEDYYRSLIARSEDFELEAEGDG